MLYIKVVVKIGLCTADGREMNRRTAPVTKISEHYSSQTKKVPNIIIDIRRNTNVFLSFIHFGWFYTLQR